MKNKILLIVSAILLNSVTCFASSLEVADSAYAKGNYEEAALLYSQVIEQEGFSAEALYNLGNIYYKLGKDGEAMLCYERAIKLDPGNSTIKKNLIFLSSKVTDANKGELNGKSGNVESDRETFIGSIYRLIAIERSSNGWAVFAVMAFILFLGALALYMFTPNVLARKTGFFSGIAFLTFTVVFLIFAYMGASQYQRQDEAILMDFTTQLLQQPDEKAESATTPLHRGTKLKILETKQGSDGTEWIKVKLNAENIGWVKKEGIEVI